MVWIAALKQAGKTGADTDVVMEPNPYPVASLFIGSYLNEVGRSDEAVAALDTGLGFEPANPLLISEKGAAYLALHQWDAALATYGGVVALTRKTIINDDLQAFTRIPAVLGAIADWAPDAVTADEAAAAYVEAARRRAGSYFCLTLAGS